MGHGSGGRLANRSVSFAARSGLNMDHALVSWRDDRMGRRILEGEFGAVYADARQAAVTTDLMGGALRVQAT